jgi:Zn finger protein HypA/HybF involved in hydrogenase expression
MITPLGANLLALHARLARETRGEPAPTIEAALEEPRAYTYREGALMSVERDGGAENCASCGGGPFLRIDGPEHPRRCASCHALEPSVQVPR